MQREQERLRKSLGKYNNFVREKAAKVEDGDRLYAEEVEFQESIEQRIREKTNLVHELEGAKVSGEDGIIIRCSASVTLKCLAESDRFRRGETSDISEVPGHRGRGRKGKQKQVHNLTRSDL